MLLSSLVMLALLGLGLWRKHAFYCAIPFLIFYIIFIGAPASAVRAGIMGFLILLAMYLGRLSYSVNSIVLAGTLMLLVNPKLLPYDVGFQLSFAAVLGIIFIYPILERWLEHQIVIASPPHFGKVRGTKQSRVIRQHWFSTGLLRSPSTSSGSLAMTFEKSGFIKNLVFLTLSAQIAVFPIVAYHFGTLSLIAPLSNILVVPLLPLIMILGFISIILGFFYWLLGFLFAWLVYLPLTYIMKLSHYFSQIPYAFLETRMHWWMVVIYYFVLIGFLVWCNNYNRKKRGLNSILHKLRV